MATNKSKVDESKDNTKIILGTIAVAGIGTALYFYFRKKVGTITVTVNIAGSWTITGPQTYSGVGSKTIENVPEGTYTITFSDVAGYVTPLSSTQTLEKGGAITFTGNYTQAGELCADMTNIQIS